VTCLNALVLLKGPPYVCLSFRPRQAPGELVRQFDIPTETRWRRICTCYLCDYQSSELNSSSFQRWSRKGKSRRARRALHGELRAFYAHSIVLLWCLFVNELKPSNVVSHSPFLFGEAGCRACSFRAHYLCFCVRGFVLITTYLSDTAYS
jgi:hypothetical protein